MNPRNLPRLRDGLVRHLTNPNSAVRTKTGAENQEALDGLTRNAQEARLFWASEDMTALAVSAGRQLDDAYWGAEARPAPAPAHAATCPDTRHLLQRHPPSPSPFDSGPPARGPHPEPRRPQAARVATLYQRKASLFAYLALRGGRCRVGCFGDTRTFTPGVITSAA